MSKRPSSTFNDPGYFYSQRRLLKIFAISSLALVIGMIAMIWQDFDRPWKDGQRAEMKWEAARFALENMMLETLTAEDRAGFAKARAVARKLVDGKQDELERIRGQLTEARGLFYDADMKYKKQKQFTGQAEYRVNEAKDETDRAHWARQLREERDKEHTLRDALQYATGKLEMLQNQEKRTQKAIDDVVALERSAPMLKRMRLLAAGIEKKKGYNPLREIPMLDFMAPPTKVEQIVLDNLVDNYEFAMPNKVDRCGTCHISAMTAGFEREKWPIQILDDNYEADPADPSTKRSRVFEEGVYRFTFDLLSSVWKKVKPGEEYPLEKSLMRDLEIHHATLGLLFLEYDDEDGEIVVGTEAGNKKNRKIWRRWTRDGDEWVESDDGTSIAEYYLALLKRMRSQWLTHPHFSDMVGDASPHPYEKFGCTTCHLGRGWSVDFGFAYHSPDRDRIDNWMTDAWVEEHGHHTPVNAKLSFEEAMQTGNAGKEYAVHIGWTIDHDQGHVWEQELGWTHEKTHAWSWPQRPMMLVQASCMKCHKEGLYRTPDVEYDGMHLGKPDVAVPDILDWEDHAKSKSYDIESDIAGEYAGRMFLPKNKKRYRPENLERGMDDFVRLGCYGCHKLDAKVYPFMDAVRKRPAPPLDSIASKTSRVFMQKWVRDPKSFRQDTRMPRFFGLSNNPKHFRFRFAEGGDKAVDGEAWADAEVYAIVEWLLAESGKRRQKFDAIDLSRGDAARGARIVAADFETSTGVAKACIACHTVPLPDALQYDTGLVKEWTDKVAKTSGGWGARMSRRQGPDLAGIGSKVDADWLYAWLKRPRGYWHDTNMPNMRLTDQEALDVAAFLMSLKHAEFDKLDGVGKNDMIMKTIAKELKVAEQQDSTGVAIAIVDKWAEEDRKNGTNSIALYVGKKLVKHYGCFGCHEISGYKDTTPIGTELTEWGSKLIERLEFNHAPIDHTRFDFAYAKLINPRIYDVGMAREDRPLERLKMPRFGLTPEEARNIATFLVSLVNAPVPEKSLFRPNQRQSVIIRGRQVLSRYNCQGCHMIEGRGGDIWPAIKQTNWRPPDLLGQGSKTKPAWLFKFMKDPAFVLEYSPAGEDRLRPWHSIRMPTFELTDEESRAIVQYFAALSDAPADFESAVDDGLKIKGEGYPKTFLVKDPTDAEGVRKVRKKVFSRLEETDAMFLELACKSCHFPDAVTGTATAPNFRHTLNGRLRGVWIERWLWGPLKLQAGTQMPVFFGVERPKPQSTESKQVFFETPNDPDATATKQVRALRDYIRYHYKDE